MVNEGRISTADLLLKNGRIEKIGSRLQPAFAVTEINGEGKHLLPGAIDDQVHFREPGLTHKATIYTEAKAAVAGGVTGAGHAEHAGADHRRIRLLLISPGGQPGLIPAGGGRHRSVSRSPSSKGSLTTHSAGR